MNKSLLISLVFCTITSLQSGQETKALVLPDLHSIQETLHDDYKNYLKGCLEHYKTTSSFSKSKLVSAAGRMQGIKTGPDYYPDTPVANDIITTKDSEGNHFIHIAVEKKHKNVVEGLVSIRSHATTMCNNKNQTPLDLCIKDMSVSTTYNPTTLEIVEILLYRMAHMSRSSEEVKALLKTSLQKVILLQLDYKKVGKELPIKTELLLKLLKFHTEEEEIRAEATVSLATLYQEAADESNGETFTHILVKQELPDELFEWIKQERVSLAKNKAGLTAVDVALVRFRQNDFTMNDYSFNKRRCCLFMLLNYCKIKSERRAKVEFENCCDQHIISQ